MRRLLKIEDYPTNQMYYRLLTDEFPDLEYLDYTRFNRMNPYIIVNIREKESVYNHYICGCTGENEENTLTYDNFKDFLNEIRNDLHNFKN